MHAEQRTAFGRPDKFKGDRVTPIAADKKYTPYLCISMSADRLDPVKFAHAFLFSGQATVAAPIVTAWICRRQGHRSNQTHQHIGAPQQSIRLDNPSKHRKAGGKPAGVF